MPADVLEKTPPFADRGIRETGWGHDPSAMGGTHTIIIGTLGSNDCGTNATFELEASIIGHDLTRTSTVGPLTH